MRTAFIDTLLELAQADERIVLIVGDLGFGVVNSFVDRLPRQIINAGVAEQNMTGLAAGIALSGKIVFTYSIANFATLRCLEQIRNDICYHGANVKVVAVGGGLAYGPLGFSHHATEDLAVLRALPNLTVVAPGDPVEARHATRAIAAHEGPCYLRLGRADEAVVHDGGIDFRLGRAITVRDGGDVALVTTGGMLAETVAAAEELARRGVRARVISMHTIKPLDQEVLIRAARDTGAVVTIEEHSLIGGLGGAVAEGLLEGFDGPVKFRRVALADRFASCAGSQTFLRSQHGVDREGIIRAVGAVLEQTPQFL